MATTRQDTRLFIDESDDSSEADSEDDGSEDLPPGVLELFDFVHVVLVGATEKECHGLWSCLGRLKLWQKTRLGPPPVQECKSQAWDILARSDRFVNQTMECLPGISQISVMILALIHKKSALVDRFHGNSTESQRWLLRCLYDPAETLRTWTTVGCGNATPMPFLPVLNDESWTLMVGDCLMLKLDTYFFRGDLGDTYRRVLQDASTLAAAGISPHVPVKPLVQLIVSYLLEPHVAPPLSTPTPPQVPSHSPDPVLGTAPGPGALILKRKHSS